MREEDDADVEEDALKCYRLHLNFLKNLDVEEDNTDVLKNVLCESIMFL